MEVNCGESEEEEIIILDTLRKCFPCLSTLNEPSSLINLQKLFSTLNLNYEEAVKKAGDAQVEGMISDGVAAELKLKICNSCAASLEEVSQAEGALSEVTFHKDGLFKELIAVDRPNTLQELQIARLHIKACEEVLIAEGKPTEARRQFCRLVVEALEDEEKLENFKNGKPSTKFAYFVKAFVLNLRLEFNVQCKADLNLDSKGTEAVPPCQENLPTPSSSSSALAPAPPQPPSNGISNTSGSSSTSKLNLQLSLPSSSHVSLKPKRAARLKAAGKMAKVIGALKTSHHEEPKEHNGGKNRPRSLKIKKIQRKVFERVRFHQGFVYKSQHHFHMHDKTHFTCLLCKEELTANKSVRGKARGHFLKFHYQPDKNITPPKPFLNRNKRGRLLIKKIPKRVALPQPRKGFRPGFVYNASEHFNCQGKSNFRCKYCKKTYDGEDVRNAARLHFLRNHYNPKKNGGQKKRAGIPIERFGVDFKAPEHFNFKGKSFCQCKYCPQTYSGGQCGKAARMHFLGKHFEEWMNQESSRTSHQGDTAPDGAHPELATNLKEGSAATADEMNMEDVPLDELEVDSPSYSPLSIEEREASSPDEENDVSLNLKKIRHGCGFCGEHYESQSDVDEHFKNNHME